MGAVKTKVAKNMHAAIRKNDIERARMILEKYPGSANFPIHNGNTTALCRATYLGKKEMAQLFLEFDAKINEPSKRDGNTPLMWAAWRNNTEMINFLLEKGADISVLNNEGDNALDIAISRVSYEAALILKKNGLDPKEEDYYTEKTATEFDIDVFIQYIREEIEVADKNVFFQKVKLREEQEAAKDMVIDPRESWKHWFKRTATFEDPPMVEREELPEEQRPHKSSMFNKVENMMNGINPYPPGHKWNKSQSMRSDSVRNESSIPANEPRPEMDEYLDEECKGNDKENSHPSAMTMKRDQMTIHDA